MDNFDNVELKKNNGDIIYPRTKTNSIYDENGDRLDNLLEDIPLLSDELSTEDLIPKDADMLGGQPKSYFEALVQAVNERVAPIEAAYPQLSNPNLLINPDFKVWQRGVSLHITDTGGGNKYIADRWNSRLFQGTDLVISLDANGLRIDTTASTNSSTHAGILQKIEINANKVIGKQFTCSASIDGVIYKNSVVIAAVDTTYNMAISPGGTTWQFRLAYESATNTLVFTIYMYGTQRSSVINWAKLEFGSNASPLVPRLYKEELGLCQYYYRRYYRLSGADAGKSTYLIAHMSQVQPGAVVCSFNYPAMRTNPVISDHGSLQLRLITQGTGLAGDTIYSMDNSMIGYFHIWAYNANIVNTSIYQVGTHNASADGSLYLELDAEIY